MRKLNLGAQAKTWGKKVTFNVPVGPGSWNKRGRYVRPGTKVITAVATVLPLTSEDLRFYEAGTYTTQDKKILVEGDVDLPVGTRFLDKGNTYEVREERDYEVEANFRRYVAKKVGDAD